MNVIPPSIRAQMTLAAYHISNKLPPQAVQERLKNMGWKFEKTKGLNDEDVNVIVHKDGTPMPVSSSPGGFLTSPLGEQNPTVVEEYYAKCKRRAEDLKKALTEAYTFK